MRTATITAMTSPRRNLFAPGQAGAYHCVSRCVRRAWLCGVDRYTGKSFEHRKSIVETRIQQLGDIFAVGIHTYAIMSNHVHIVLSVAARAAYDWPDEEVARRWLCFTHRSQSISRLGMLSYVAIRYAFTCCVSGSQACLGS